MEIGFQFVDENGLSHVGDTELDRADERPSEGQSVTVQYIPGTDEARFLGQFRKMEVNLFVIVNLGIIGLGVLKLIAWQKGIPLF